MCKHLVTVYKNVDDDGSKAVVGQSHTILLSNLDVAAYTNIVCILSDFFCKAELWATRGGSVTPAYCSIIVHPTCLNKWKDQDADTLMDRLWWIINNLKDPTNGAIVSIYLSDTIDKDQEYPWAMNHLWQTKQTWVANDSNTISIQDHAEHQWSKYDPKRLFIAESVKIIKSAAKKLKYNIEYVDYTTPIDTLYDIMLNTKYHFSYTGSTGLFAALTRTPTIYFGRNAPTGTIGLWNYWAGHIGQTLQTDPTTGHLVLQEPSYYTAVNANDCKYLQNLEHIVASVL